MLSLSFHSKFEAFVHFLFARLIHYANPSMRVMDMPDGAAHFYRVTRLRRCIYLQHQRKPRNEITQRDTGIKPVWGSLRRARVNQRIRLFHTFTSLKYGHCVPDFTRSHLHSGVPRAEMKCCWQRSQRVGGSHNSEEYAQRSQVFGLLMG
nr:MAG TPA_asm: hypothetical protein [Caudoviricetes sp.]